MFGSEQAFLLGVSGTGAAGSLSSSVATGLLGVAGIGVAGGVSGQTTGGNVNVNVPGVAGIGVAGIITVSGAIVPLVPSGGNGGSKKKVKPTVFLPVPRKGMEKFKAPSEPEPVAKPAPKPAIAAAPVKEAVKPLQSILQKAIAPPAIEATSDDEARTMMIVARYLEHENDLREKATKMLNSLLASIQSEVV